MVGGVPVALNARKLLPDETFGFPGAVVGLIRTTARYRSPSEFDANDFDPSLKCHFGGQYSIRSVLNGLQV